MRKIVVSNKFKKDLIVASKRGFDLKLLNTVIQTLANGETLDPKYKDHPLIGNFVDFRECHIMKYSKAASKTYIKRLKAYASFSFSIIIL